MTRDLSYRWILKEFPLAQIDSIANPVIASREKTNFSIQVTRVAYARIQNII